MKFILLYISLVFVTFFSLAQTPPWKYVPTTKNHNINISAANVTVDNAPLEAGDLIGAFYDSSGQLACGGYVAWPSAQLIAYGDDSGIPNGFSVNEPFKFKIWKKNENCIIDTGTIIQFQYQPGIYDDSVFFKVNGKSKLITLNGSKKEIYYAKTNYCLGDPDPFPVKKGIIPDAVYSSQSGLSINPVTGQINIAASLPGTYTVFFQTSLCLKANSFLVKIKLNIDNLGVNVIKSTCTAKGQVMIDENTIQCGNPPYQYRLRNIITGQDMISSVNTISEVNDGTYKLYINDNNHQEVEWMNSLLITKECKDLIIAPNSTGQASSYFISSQGKAKIYDRFGILKKEMAVPANWDATDDSGNQVPMGEYIIICNESEHTSITVIK